MGDEDLQSEPGYLRRKGQGDLVLRRLASDGVWISDSSVFGQRLFECSCMYVCCNGTVSRGCDIYDLYNDITVASISFPSTQVSISTFHVVYRICSDQFEYSFDE